MLTTRAEIHEVPTIYRRLSTESKELMTGMTEAEKGTPEYVALRMSKFGGRTKHTAFAGLWSALSSGSVNALRLMPR